MSRGSSKKIVGCQGFKGASAFLSVFLFQGGDAAYLTNIHTEFDSHKDYVKGDDRRNWDKEFGIRHYAGTVTYKVEGFVDKNRDSQQDVFFDYLEKSKKNFVHELVEFKVRKSAASRLTQKQKRNIGKISQSCLCLDIFLLNREVKPISVFLHELHKFLHENKFL